MKRFTVLLLCALCAGLTWALPPMPETLDRREALTRAAETTREKAPDANAQTFAQTRYATYAPDGTGMVWAEFWSKALTERGAKELRDVPLEFKEGFSEAEFQLAEVIRADGTVVPVDLQANVSEATSNRGTEANIYDDTSKRLVLTVPKVLVGDTLHVILAYRTARARIPDTYSDFELFESMEGPIPYAALTILAPKELPLRSTAVLGEIPGTVTASNEKLADGRTLHRWVARDVPQAFAEANMPEESTELQRVVVSTFPSWEELSKWYWGLCEPHLKTTPEIDAKVAELTAGKTREAQIEALFGFVAQGIRYMGIIAEDTAPGYEPHDVSLTFENRYGVCRDKGALLVAMLRKAGFEAFPVLISAGQKRDKEVPIPYFNHAVVAIDTGNREYRLLDPTDDTARAVFPAYLSDCTYLVTRPEGDTLRLTPVPSPSENLMDIATTGTLDGAGTLTLQASLRFGGMNDNVYRPLFVSNPLDRIRDRFDGILKKTAPGAELSDFSFEPKDPKDISQPLIVHLTARVPGYAQPDADGHTLIDLPFLSRSVGLVNFLFRGLDQPTRKYDWVIAAPCAVQERLTLNGLGRLGTPSLLPDDPILKVNGASYDIVCKRADDGTLKLERTLELSHKTYTPEDYRSLRRFVERMDRFEALRPLFMRPPEQDADAIVLRDLRETVLDAPDRAATRRVRDVRVLTYQGKRDVAEVKLSHNPANEKLTVVSAEVASASGDRVAVTPKEINVLDAAGAALAPRYPFPKQTVIALPAVDVGAVTHLEWRVEAERTLPFCETMVFGGPYPTQEQVYSLSVPLALDADLRLAERNFDGCDVARSVVTNDARVVRAWTVRALPAVRPEPRTPPAGLFRPTLHVSLREAAAFRTLPDVIARAEDTLRAGSDAAEAAAKTAVKGLDRKDANARLRAVQTLLARRIRTLGPAWHDLPTGTFTAPDVSLAEGYANRMDRLLLQLAMLRAVGVEGSLVFAQTHSLADAFLNREAYATRAVPRWSLWVRPYIRLDDGRLVGDEGEFDEPGATAIGSRSLMTAAGRVLYDQPSALRSRDQETTRIVIRPDGDAVISAETLRYGLEAGAARKAERDFTPETRRRAVAALAEALASGAMPVSEYIVDTAAYPVRSRIAVEAKGYASRQGRLLSVPVDRLVGAVYGLRGTQRENPVWQRENDGSVSVFELWFPKGAELVSKPEPFVCTLPGGGAYTLTCDVEPQPHTGLLRLTYRTTYAAAPALLDSWLYPALTELDRRLLAPVMGTVVVRLPE